MDANFTLEDPETFKNVIPLTRLDSVDARHRNRHALITVPKNSLKLMQEKVSPLIPTHPHYMQLRNKKRLIHGFIAWKTLSVCVSESSRRNKCSLRTFFLQTMFVMP